MSQHAWGFIFLGGADGDPATDRAVIEAGGARTMLVGVADRSQAPAVARELVGDGAQFLELCGGFGAADVEAVRAATESAVPVGSVHYDADDVVRLGALFG